jgi:RNA recognition motif-containing protein
MWVRNNKGNIFVGNLPPDFADERLAEAFDPFGIVLSAGVARDPSTGARLRYGFVDIATERAAAQAIAALDGSEIDGCKLNVKPRDKAAKKPGMGPPRRPGPRGAAPRGASPYAARTDGESRDFAEAPPRVSQSQMPQRETTHNPAAPDGPVAHSPVAHSPVAQSPVAQSPVAQSQTARSQALREGLPEIEPPPRRDFEVVRRPIRRTTPSFQVERRPLPRRV